MIDKKLFDEVELQNAQSKALFQHKVQALNEEMAKLQALQQEHAALEESFRQPAPPPVDPMAEVDAYLNQAPQRTAEEPAPVVAPPQDTSEVEAPKATSTRHKAVNPGLYKSVIEGLSSKYDIPSKLLMSVVHSESGFNPNATSSAGAIGLMQLMPGTARDLGVDPTDPMQNLEGGTRYLKQQLDRFGSVPLALAAYNAGPGAVKKYGGVPPFKETRDYVDKVMEGVGKYADGGLVGLYQKYEDGGKVKDYSGVIGDIYKPQDSDFKDLAMSYGQPANDNLGARLEDATPFERSVYNKTGLEPGIERPILFPRYDPETGWTAPEIVNQGTKAFLAGKEAWEGTPITPEETLSMAALISPAGIGSGSFAKLAKIRAASPKWVWSAGEHGTPQELRALAEKNGADITDLTENIRPGLPAPPRQLTSPAAQLTPPASPRQLTPPAQHLLEAPVAEVPPPVYGVEEKLKPAPMWFSHLAQRVEAAPKQVFSTGDNIKAWLNANKGPLGIKQAEIDATGLHDYLTLKGTEKVTKGEVANYLANNGVQVTEVMKGEPEGRYGNEMYQHPETGDIDTIENWRRITEDFSDEGGPSIDDQLRTLIPVGGNEKPAISGPKFGDWQLPGGKNYRELLLTLPNKPIEPSIIDFKISDTYKGESVYKGAVQGGDAIIHHNPGFPWIADLPRGESMGGFSSAEEAMAALNERFNPNPRVQEFQSNHYDEPNILAHVRFNDRVDPDNKKVLFIEESQSDWAQRGRKEGFKTGTWDNEKEVALDKSARYLRDTLREDDNLGFDTAAEAMHAILQNPDYTDRWELSDKSKIWAQAYKEAMNEKKAAQTGIEPAPYVSSKRNASVRLNKETGAYDVIYGSKKEGSKKVENIAGTYATEAEAKSKAGELTAQNIQDPSTEAWTALVIKRMMHYAAENGYDKVAFINGQQSADRYNLSKKISEIHYSGSNLKAYDHNGKTVINQTGVSQSDLPEYIGKEVADKLLAQVPQGTLRSLVGQDINVGGEGMKAYYDQIVTKVAKEAIKKHGGKLEPVMIKVRETGLPSSENWADFGIDRVGQQNLWEIIDRKTGQKYGESYTDFDSAYRKRDQLSHSESKGFSPYTGFTITPAMRQNILGKGMPTFKKGGLVELYQKYEDGGKAALSPDKVKQIIADEKQFAKNWFAERDLLPFNKAIMAYNLNQDNPIEYRDVIDNDPTTLAQTEGKKIILTPGADENAVREETEHTARDWAIPTRLYDAGVYQGNRKTLDQYTKDFKSGNIKGTYPADTDIYQMYAYLNKPEEGHARLMELRRLAKFNPKQKISQEDLDNFYKNYDKKSHRVNQLLDMTNDTGLIEMLNYMSKNDSRPDKQELINALTNKNYA